jgi:hypothetical protein
MKAERIIIINVFSKKGTRLGKEFHSHGREVIGVASSESVRGVDLPLDWLDQLFVSDDAGPMVSTLCHYNKCDAICG